MCDGLVVPQDPTQSKQWSLCHLSYMYRGSKMYLKPWLKWVALTFGIHVAWIMPTTSSFYMFVFQMSYTFIRDINYDFI